MMSAAHDDTAGGATPPSRVGAELRAARLRLGWPLPDVAQNLRIRLPYLEAIEDGRVADLPGAAYAIGFVRTYAQSLGLDPDEIARRFRSETQEVNQKTELSFPAPVPERGVPAGAVVLLGLVLVVGAYAGWYKMTAVRPADTGVAAVPERLAPLIDRGTATTLSPQVASILPPAPAPMSPSQLPPSQLPQPSSPQPSSAQAAPVMLPSIPVPVPVPVSITPLPQAGIAPAPDGGRVVLKFKSNAYIQVREKQGPVLLNRVMRAGESWPVPKSPNLVMLTGNAGGTDILVDGIQAAPLGGDGVVKRDVSLEPEAIKLPAGIKLPAQPAGMKLPAQPRGQ